MHKKFFLILIVFFFNTINSTSKENVFIIASIDNDILTNYDVKKEIEYLNILNPGLSQLDKNKIIKISKDSLINEIIKKKEIMKTFDISADHPYLKDSIKEFYTKLNFNDENDFKNYLKNNLKYSFDEIKSKLKIEILWNELVYLKYNDQVNIDKEKMLEKINKLDDQIYKEYKLSEIVFKKKKDESLESLIDKIKLSISQIGFNNTANIYSFSDSSKMGGQIGWVSENNLSDLISIKIQNIQEGQYSDVIQIGNNYIILLVEKIKQTKILVNKEDELNKMVKFETNKQLNQFSKIFFDKSKMNYTINEK